MKKIRIFLSLATAGLFLLAFNSQQAQAQWSTNGDDIYNSNSGNVGIGTSAPSTRLHVAGGDVRLDNNQYVTVTRSDDSFGHQVFGMDSNNDMILNRSAIVHNRASRTVIAFGQRSFDIRNQSNTTLVRVEPDGDMGIGTTDTRGYKLAVAGNVIAESVLVRLQASWPDYVFEDDHQLKKLEEVESYIKEHKHLPGIPSACEVEEQGIDLGNMDAKLLEKIEELTLYVIELKKENEAMKAAIEALK